ncbi:hypothetical protein Glove_362g25 [Diversispora epigaea]|uniref:Protein kinase domain-containing protein n=1 Tax=Diversispora epigaea TaxID=1348612 RepID=A0A397HCE9_9GLOM|nr:hypothetical protein Glove_362g25 [Diversispora epigaea]
MLDKFNNFFSNLLSPTTNERETVETGETDETVETRETETNPEITHGSVKWLEKAIEDGYILSFDYSEFHNIKEIGRGGFGTVHSAEWKRGDQEVALKQLNTNELNQATLKEFTNELFLLRNVSYHPNVNKFFGITRDPQKSNYIMILKYANNGNLREYLRKKKKTLKWGDKHRMCFEIAKGLRCLHSEEIIHKDLHSKNILIDNGRMMIADLGLSKRLDESVSTSNHRGMYGYIDPQCYNNPRYKRTKKSDIYSLGILFWEISTCQIPLPYLALNPAPGIPRNFIDLYERCKDNNPDERPDIEEIVRILGETIPSPSQEIPNIEESLVSDDDEKPYKSYTESHSNSNSQLHLHDSISFPVTDEYTSFLHVDREHLENSDISEPYFSAPEGEEGDDNNNNNNNDYYYYYKMTGETSSSPLPPLPPSPSSLNNNNIASKLKEMIKLYEDNIRFGSNRSEKKYSKWINNHSSERLESMLNYLKDNKDFPRRELFIGLFYENGYGITRNSKEAFRWFKKASKKGDTIGHYKVGNCYYNDFGVENDYHEALKYFELAAAADDNVNNKEGSKAGLTGIANHMLGLMYNNGHGIDKDTSEAFKFIKKAAKSGYVPAQYWLADFYYEGTGTEKNSEKAQEWYKKCNENGGYVDPGIKFDSLRKVV